MPTGQALKSPKVGENCNKSFQTKTCLGFFFYTLSSILYIYISEREVNDATYLHPISRTV